jgi:sulfur carrier protein
MKFLHLNGEERNDFNASTVEELVIELKLPPPTLLVEHNGIALHRKEWSATFLQSGDRIELLHVVAGG